MDAFFDWFNQFISHSLGYALFAIALIVFLESLALIGLLIPGTVMMTAIGALIGGGKIDFFAAWGACIVGCLLGDWSSYFIGRQFKQPLRNWSFIKRHGALFARTEHALNHHSMLTIILGRFIGPTRPLIPMAAGMLNLTAYKFFPPNVIACVTWPPVYLLPGILAGVAIEIPENANSHVFKWLLLGVFLLIWLAAWLCWRWWRFEKQSEDWLSPWMTLPRLRIVAIVAVAVSGYGAWMLYKNPLMSVYCRLLYKVISG